ncbi:MAG: hypothetical protein GC129_06575 [Proteobacteria bacterium]|nr:hypothetical protein [Pseudomonadota bacterium]
MDFTELLNPPADLVEDPLCVSIALLSQNLCKQVIVAGNANKLEPVAYINWALQSAAWVQYHSGDADIPVIHHKNGTWKKAEPFTITEGPPPSPGQRNLHGILIPWLLRYDFIDATPNDLAGSACRWFYRYAMPIGLCGSRLRLMDPKTGRMLTN